jgi:hypothetical protein
MKEYKKNLIINLSIGLIITYLAGCSDIYKNGWITGNVIKDFWKSITYYLGWVLFYWWYFVIFGALLIFIFSTLIITFAIKKQFNFDYFKRILLNFGLFIIFIFLIWLNRQKL